MCGDLEMHAHYISFILLHCSHHQLFGVCSGQDARACAYMIKLLEAQSAICSWMVG